MYKNGTHALRKVYDLRHWNVKHSDLSSRAQITGEGEKVMRCNQCGTAMPGDSGSCQNCGAKYPKPKRHECRCPKCGGIMPQESAFCPFCGAKRSMDDLENLKKRRKTPVIIFTCVAALCVALILIIVCALNATDSDSTQAATAEILDVGGSTSYMGNTASNAAGYGYGVACEGVFYFSDGSGLYKMDEGETAELLTGDFVSGLNIYKGKMYGEIDDKLYSMDMSGGHKQLLCSEKCWNSIVKDDWIYYLSIQSENEYGMSMGQVCRMKIDATEKVQLTDNGVSSFIIAENYIIYCNEYDNETMYRCTLEGDYAVLISEDLFWGLSYFDGEIYYSSWENDWKLCKCDLAGDNVTIVMDKPVYTANVCEGVIYYINDSQTGLYYRFIESGESGCLGTDDFWGISAGGNYVAGLDYDYNSSCYDMTRRDTENTWDGTGMVPLAISGSIT